MGCGLHRQRNGFAEASDLAPNRGSRTIASNRLPKLGRTWDRVLVFRPHAIIVTDRSIPSPIFVAALIGVEKIFRIDFDTSLPEETFVHQALAKLPEQTIAFGRPTGVTVNYARDRAVRYNLRGDPIEILTEAIRCGNAYLTIPPNKKDMSERIGKALGLR